jgi:hypothetical protein
MYVILQRWRLIILLVPPLRQAVGNELVYQKEGDLGYGKRHCLFSHAMKEGV